MKREMEEKNIDFVLFDSFQESTNIAYSGELLNFVLLESNVRNYSKDVFMNSPVRFTFSETADIAFFFADFADLGIFSTAINMGVYPLDNLEEILLTTKLEYLAFTILDKDLNEKCSRILPMKDNIGEDIRKTFLQQYDRKTYKTYEDCKRKANKLLDELDIVDMSQSMKEIETDIPINKQNLS